MLLGFISDLHCEMNDDLISIPENIDVLVFAGDIHVKPKLLKDYFLRLRAKTNAIFLYVLGNHEYYGHEFPDIRENYKKQIDKVPNVQLLEKESTIINNVRFLGTTLWSNLSDPIQAINVQNGLNDFIKIKVKQSPNYRNLRAEDYHNEFQACSDWLEQELKKEFDGPTVVITHHSPSSITCSPYFKYSKIRFAFHSNMEELILNYSPKFWIYGHDHVSAKHELGQTMLVSNQAGYPHEHRKGATLSVIEV